MIIAFQGLFRIHDVDFETYRLDIISQCLKITRRIGFSFFAKHSVEILQITPS